MSYVSGTQLCFFLKSPGAIHDVTSVMSVVFWLRPDAVFSSVNVRLCPRM